MYRVTNNATKEDQPMAKTYDEAADPAKTPDAANAPAPAAAELPNDDSDSPEAREARRTAAAQATKDNSALQKAETRAREAEAQAQKMVDENLKLQDKLKKSALTDKDKRDITLAVRTTETDIMDPVRYEQLRILARDFYASGQVPKTYESEAQVFSAMQIGVELGMSPRAALLNGYFIDGRYEVWGKAVGGILRMKGFRWKFIDEDEGSTTIQIWPKDDPKDIIEDTFTYEEAEQSGFTTYTNKYTQATEDKLGWRPGANRKRKLRYGVISQVVHTYLPDVMGSSTGIAEYSEDYLEAAREQNAKDNAPVDKAAKRQNIGKAMAAFKSTTLEEVKPRAIDTDAPNMQAIAQKTADRSTGDAERDSQDIQ